MCSHTLFPSQRRLEERDQRTAVATRFAACVLGAPISYLGLNRDVSSTLQNSCCQASTGAQMPRYGTVVLWPHVDDPLLILGEDIVATEAHCVEADMADRRSMGPTMSARCIMQLNSRVGLRRRLWVVSASQVGDHPGPGSIARSRGCSGLLLPRQVSREPAADFPFLALHEFERLLLHPILQDFLLLLLSFPQHIHEKYQRPHNQPLSREFFNLRLFYEVVGHIGVLDQMFSLRPS